MKRALIPCAILIAIALGSCRKETPAITTTTTTVAPTDTAPPPIVPTVIQSADAAIPTTGLQMWLRPELGTSSAMDGAVSTWRSPNNIVASTSDAAKQPKFIADGAGKMQPVVHFDGIDDVMETNLEVNPAVSPTLTIVSVFRSDTADKVNRKLYGHDDGGFDLAAGLDSRGDHNYTVFGGTAHVIGYFDLPANTWTITVDTFAIDKFSGWVNGKPVITNHPVSFSTGAKNLFIGGSGNKTPEPWQGDLGDMLVYNRALTDAERVALEDSLAKKYGMTLTR